MKLIPNYNRMSSMEYSAFIFNGSKWVEITPGLASRTKETDFTSSTDTATPNRKVVTDACLEIYNEVKNLKVTGNCKGKLNILFWTINNLRDENAFRKFAEQFFIEKIKLLKPTEDQLEISELNPVLNLGTVDFYDKFLDLALVHSKTATREELYKRSIENESSVKDYVKYYRFLDSCIWTRYLWTGSKHFSTSLKLLIKNYFCFNYELSLYSTSVAYEYIDLQCRLMLESRINDLGNSRGHSKAIVPFGFQSETELICYTSIEARKLKNNIEKSDDILTEEKIRLFLWDDKADEKLSSVRSSQINFTKGDILIALLKNFLHHSEEDLKISLDKYIDTHLFQAKTKKSESTFDLILCDFLLDNNDSTFSLSTNYILHYLTNDTGKEYDFLRKSKTGDKLWLFPISSFNLAMSEKFAQLGFEYFSKSWVMSDGADFINTPNGFRYKFTEFLLHMIEESGVNLFEENKHSLIEYLISLVERNDKQAYIEAYPKIININQKYLELAEDLKSKKKGFTRWAINRVYNGVSDIFMEHLVHLMHFLAFSSSVQKHQMLEEVNFLYERWPVEKNKEKFYQLVNAYILNK